jgi:hypothetical protein
MPLAAAETRPSRELGPDETQDENNRDVSRPSRLFSHYFPATALSTWLECIRMGFLLWELYRSHGRATEL